MTDHGGDGPIRWRLLGPVKLVLDDRDIDLGPGKQLCVLATLLLTPGRTVPVETIIDRVWGERPPRSRNAVAPYITRLRRVLDASASRAGGEIGAIRYATGGYRLDCDPDAVDLLRYRRLAGRARAALRAGQAEIAVELLDTAVAGWPSVALAGVPGEWAGRTRDAVALERLDLIGERARAQLELGRAEDVVESLRAVVAENPTVEPLVALLMTALDGTARSSEALDCYAVTRRAIADRLGAEPSRVLQELHLRILREGPPATGARTLARPAQLPPDAAGFAGRRVELDLLDEPERIAVISGTAGVGKSALAVHWAHRAADAFPDGQLYCDLRGFGPEEAIDPSEVLSGFLDALGVEPHRIPPDGEARQTLYRSVSAGLRLLVVLDNARDADQVRPLLAGGPAVRTVVTSRNRLVGLIAEVGARPVVLDPPGHADAVEMLRRRLGPEAADPELAAEVVAACGRLPLALALVAARTRQSGFLPPSLAAELRRPGLAGLTDARAVFSWSYRCLTPLAARTFRLLGLTAGPDIAPDAVAALAGLSREQAGRALRELSDVSLVTEHTSGRYRMHDLLRSYAGELAAATESDEERRAAVTRLLDHYTYRAYQADLVLNPSRPPIPASVGAPDVDGSPKTRFDFKAAREWLGTERAVLLSALRQAADEGLHRNAWQLGWALDTFFTQESRWRDEGAAWAVALSAATALVDPRATAHAHRFLAVVAGRLDRFGDAHVHMGQAIAMCRAAGDRPGEAETLYVLSYVCWLQGDHDRALDHVRRSLDVWAELGHPTWEAKAHNAVGWYTAQLGGHREALPHYERALRLHQGAGDLAEEAIVHDNIGLSQHGLGRHESAAGHFEYGLPLALACEDLLVAARIADHLGDAYEAMGDHASARERWQEAGRILADAGDPQAGDVARKGRR